MNSKKCGMNNNNNKNKKMKKMQTSKINIKKINKKKSSRYSKIMIMKKIYDRNNFFFHINF